jgi:hypothetical protein
LSTIAGKIAYFYNETTKETEITQKKFKEGKKVGQIYYSIKLVNNTFLRAQKEDLTLEK